MKKFYKKKLQAEQSTINAHAAQIKSEVLRYTVKIRDKVTHNLLWQGDKNLACFLHVRLAPDGQVQQVKIEMGAPNMAYCHAAERAVYKASPLPVPESPEVFESFRQFILTVKSEQLICAA